MKVLELIFITMQPSRWWRCSVILISLFFTGGAWNIIIILKMIVAFLIFSLLTGAINIMDDIADLEKDKQDLLKRTKPLASGELSVNKAEFSVAMLLIGSFVAAFFFGPLFGAAAVGYFFIELCYYLFFKKIAVVDSLAIAGETCMLFIAGTVASGKVLSSWLFVFVVASSVFLVFCENKRRLALSPEDQGLLKKYGAASLGRLIDISAPFVLIIYSLYTLISPDGIRFNLVYTVPFAMYAVYRIMMLIDEKTSDKGFEKILLKDRNFIVAIGSWAALLLVLTSIF
ncbi:MAG: UbiA family prenyltransferase [Candidatus Saganbacteria bacterium]|nr:UbiA family prenyltransferase [Candidatus Saganbacteria bacterium]